jgi:hypothetical protein
MKIKKENVIVLFFLAQMEGKIPSFLRGFGMKAGKSSK